MQNINLSCEEKGKRIFYSLLVTTASSELVILEEYLNSQITLAPLINPPVISWLHLCYSL
jgi:hypothetical protein